jgi:hypothetical protein
MAIYIYILSSPHQNLPSASFGGNPIQSEYISLLYIYIYCPILRRLKLSEPPNFHSSAACLLVNPSMDASTPHPMTFGPRQPEKASQVKGILQMDKWRGQIGRLFGRRSWTLEDLWWISHETWKKTQLRIKSSETLLFILFSAENCGCHRQNWGISLEFFFFNGDWPSSSTCAKVVMNQWIIIILHLDYLERNYSPYHVHIYIYKYFIILYIRMYILYIMYPYAPYMEYVSAFAPNSPKCR